MRLIRSNWLTGLTCHQFNELNPWDFVIHPESEEQWLAEIRQKLSIRLRDDEILSILYPGLFSTVKAAIKNYGDGPAENRGNFLCGYALKYIRIYGLALVVDEVPGANSYNVAELDTIEQTPRAHALQHEYMQSSSNFTEGLDSQPQFLSDGVVLSNEALQIRHQNIEQIRRYLTPREHQILRLSVLERQESTDISDMLGLGKRQVWKVRRSLNRRLADIAIAQGACPKYVASIHQKAIQAETA
ncbi:DNA-binding CsgD family transcriptional regulator [Pseudomonas frederiksbergensis]|uniref:hypothetical protein n=1 Tax=Pseudomonas TaxID=286 RepID=UPI003D1B1EF5